MTVRRYVEAQAPARLRFWCWALFLTPFGVFLVAEVVSRLLSVAPSGNAEFVPTPQVMAWSMVFAALYASVFTALLVRLRGYLTDDFWDRWRNYNIGRQSLWLIGALLFGFVGLLGANVFCGAINRVFGQVVFETWRVQGKENDLQSSGCHYRVHVQSRINDNATRLCVTRERWEALRVDDAFPITAIFSTLGSQIAPTPAADGKGGGA